MQDAIKCHFSFLLKNELLANTSSKTVRGRGNKNEIAYFGPHFTFSNHLAFHLRFYNVFWEVDIFSL